MRVLIDILIIIACVAFLFKVYGKSIVQSVLLFVAVLLLEDCAAHFFGTIGVVVYLILVVLFLLAVYFTRSSGNPEERKHSHHSGKG